MGPQEMRDCHPTVVAVSTPPGRGGIAVVRVSGSDSLPIFSKAWRGAIPDEMESHTVHLGWIVDSSGADIDQVVVTIYRAPNSYTGEDVVEISCHGSPWIQQTIVNRLIESGASPAAGGEFTRRAFLNGRLDLAQAEGVADMIAASSAASARLAASQLRGDFSKQLEGLRQKLIDLGSLLELELDFSEEDVEFANRTELINLTETILKTIRRLASSYRAGNVFKNGIPVAIAGIPNAGKSTLLNALIGEDKAIVSDIAGTTRDVIEDTAEIGGLLFRFYDTAGLRESADTIESIGIERARRKISEAYIVVRLIDPTSEAGSQMLEFPELQPETKVIDVIGKKDLIESHGPKVTKTKFENPVLLSAKTGEGMEELKERLMVLATSEFNPEQELVVTNARHYKALLQAEEPLERLLEGLRGGISADFLAQDLREAEHHLGTITGAVTSTDILHTIFARYCIGK